MRKGANGSARGFDRARGTLLGLAVGDALGGPVERMTPSAIRGHHGGALAEMVGGGWLDLRPGQITDDTEMALALAGSLAEVGWYDPDHATSCYLRWFEQGGPVGATTRAVLEQVGRGADAAHAATQLYESTGRAAGNGSLMRIAPLAVRYAADPGALAAAARVDSHLTHGDPLAADACVYFTGLLSRCLLGPDADDREPAPSGSELAAATNPDRGQASRRAAAQRGFVLTALSVAVTALHTAETFEDALVWAVGLGFDTDTNAAVTGALLGARHGAGAIPQRWLDPLEPRAELERLADRLWAAGGRQDQ